TRVELREQLGDGSLKYIKHGITDASGLIIFDAPDIGAGRTYVAMAKSPHDGIWKQSPPILAKGATSFTVGNPPLNVTLINGLTGQPLANEAVAAMEILTDGSHKWTSARTTDTQGQAVFDLDGLGSGTNYVLRTIPYNGGYVYTPEVNAPGDITLKVGELPITVLDGDGSGPLTATRVELREQLGDGSLKYIKHGITDASGLIIFDAPDIGAGRTYVAMAKS
ncbi:MAG: hypothetical protein GY942_18335, partial [Aestuariibacter sp.]|nr:hypothetical protein [Aestuariibacter sp.]